MEINLNRRALLIALGVAGMTLPLSELLASESGTVVNDDNLLLGCAIDQHKNYVLGISQINGTLVTTVPLPSRGHGIAHNITSNEVAVFARRPGHYLTIIDSHIWQVKRTIVPDEGRHFYGHGVFSPDGRFLYTTEGISSTSQGVIGCYEVARGYLKVNEIPAYGIGPHQLTFFDPTTLAICIGGIQTQGRTVVNLDKMQSGLNLVSVTGDLLEQSVLTDNKMSIRHIHGNESTGLLVGLQEKRVEKLGGSLLAYFERGRGLIEIEPDDSYWSRFDGYVGSVAQTDQHIIATSPHGHCFGVWNKINKQLVRLKPLHEVCGVASLRNDFYVSSGTGRIKISPTKTDLVSRQSPVYWDNHMIVIENLS
ncbi:DUF1513 domain-containing protein [Vibrio sp. FNV 38]|nr:DUF1513 domain-containing protein [Vibrio sp. FNV 38]